jgi:hypothetical protein
VFDACAQPIVRAGPIRSAQVPKHSRLIAKEGTSDDYRGFGLVPWCSRGCLEGAKKRQGQCLGGKNQQTQVILNELVDKDLVYL